MGIPAVRSSRRHALQHGVVQAALRIRLLERIRTLSQLPSKARITALIKQAMTLSESGVKRVTRKPAALEWIAEGKHRDWKYKKR